MLLKHLTLLVVSLTIICQGSAMAEQVGHVTGVGGVFVKSKDPKALAQWYRDVLGLEIRPWGGAAMPFDTPGHPPKVSWTPFPATSDVMSPSTREFMINFTVDDMDAIIARVIAKGVPILKRDDNDAFGRFAWIQDPDGTKLELWQPKKI